MPNLDIASLKNDRNQFNPADGNNLLINAGFKADSLFCGFEIYAANTGSVFIQVKKVKFLTNKKILMQILLFKIYNFPYIGNYNFFGDKLNEDPTWFPVKDSRDPYPPFNIYSQFYNIYLTEGYNYYNTPCKTLEKNVFFFMYSDPAQKVVAVNITGSSAYPDFVMNWSGANYQKISPAANLFFLIRPVVKYNFYKKRILLKTKYGVKGSYSIVAKMNVPFGLVLSQQEVSVTNSQGKFFTFDANTLKIKICFSD